MGGNDYFWGLLTNFLFMNAMDSAGVGVALESSALWRHFEALCAIPRPSKNEGRAAAYVVSFARSLGLECHQDEAGNVVVRKPASPGMEQRKGVILQAHLDMVPQKNEGHPHCFDTDPIQWERDGDWIRARGTTLGADNGVGAAAALAVLEASDLEHGPLEALFTVDEETGMTGAMALEPGLLQGEILLNLDTEDEHELCIGCAGGLDLVVRFPFTLEPVEPRSVGFRVALTGLRGGHSGMDIVLQRANAHKLLVRFLSDVAHTLNVQLVSLDGGTVRNAIPRESFAVVAVPAAHLEPFMQKMAGYQRMYQSDYASVDEGVTLGAEELACPEMVMDMASQELLLNALYALPNGVMRMNPKLPGVVETSTNLAVLSTGDEEVTMQCLLRSASDSMKSDLARMMMSVCTLAGADVQFSGGYPGWKPDPESEILGIMRDLFRKLKGRDPEVTVVHAGLECGIIGAAYPGLQMISFGPTIQHPHSPDEKLYLPSLKPFWELLTGTLRQIPERG